MPPALQLAPVSYRVWDTKYRLRLPDGTAESSPVDTWQRVAHALASAEAHDREQWAQRFFAALQDFRFLPGGRILAGAGSDKRVTLFNCFVMGRIEDSLDGIFTALREGALTMQQGGGVGYDFSSLRPRGTPAKSVGALASGPVSFMRIWDSMCATIVSSSARRGAMMATLRCDHPDIEEFIDAKRAAAELRHFNLSVLVSDAFMQAVREDVEWPLVFPSPETAASAGQADACRVYRRVRAQELWTRILQSAYDCAEPGVLFIDRVNRANNLRYCETISATNPCGEIPLPPYGACNLGSINLTQFVQEPFGAAPRMDFNALRDMAALATRMLDNVYEVSGFPFAAQGQAARAARRVGLGVTGVADALIMLGVPYGSERALALGAEIMQSIACSAYRASIALAQEKGAFPLLDRRRYLDGEFVSRLPWPLREGIRESGIRNSHLLAIAPAGTISLLANNVSSGLEPAFAWTYRRRVREADGSLCEIAVEDYAHALWRSVGESGALPPAFVTASEVPPQAHLAMQAALQQHVDNAISKTVNLPASIGFAAFCDIYQQAYALGLKGLTTFRPTPTRGEVLVTAAVAEPDAHCCAIEREAD